MSDDPFEPDCEPEWPDWMHDCFSPAQLDLMPVLLWQICVRWLDLSPTEKHVALTLATYMAARTLTCKPSVGTLARDTGRKRLTVRAAMRELERRGWLNVQRMRTSKGNERTSHRCTGVFPAHGVKVIRGATGDGKVHGLTQSAMRGGGSP